MDLSAGDEQLKRNFSCKICFEPFSKDRRYPISLNCGHTFCARCVRQLSSFGTSIACGLCRRGTYSDFRQLGKNVTLLDLLENANLLAEEDPNETTDDDEDNAPLNQPWRGANHFVSSAALTAFIDRHADLRSSVRQFLSPSQWAEFDGPLDAIRCSLFTIEGQLRDAGDSFVLQEGQLEQLEHLFQRMMSEYYHQQQQMQGPFSGFVPVRWAVSGDSDDDINVLAMTATNIWDIRTGNSPIGTGTSSNHNGTSTFGLRRPWGLLGGSSNSPNGTNASNTYNCASNSHNATTISNSTIGSGTGNSHNGTGTTIGSGTGNSHNGTGTFALRRPWGCPPLVRNVDRRRPRRSKKRTRGPYSDSSDGSAFTLFHGMHGSFDTWGTAGIDEWDQSAQSVHNYAMELMTLPEMENKQPEQSVEVATANTGEELSEANAMEEALLAPEEEAKTAPMPAECEVATQSEEKENVPDHHSEELNACAVEPTQLIPPNNHFFAQYCAELVGKLLEKTSQKDGFHLRKELNGIMTKYEAMTIGK
ncbi:hypothetical protein niasHT_039430 [Heterodera trifolii]|uniref:RING-type domain-containing protein n=1 Tax=Heterodera trifolii TaxID=157864 RepID=A0ABD2J839_9BILA